MLLGNERRDLLNVLEALDRPIAFHRAFVDFAGVAGALMLSQALYWHKRTKDKDGWFYKTQEEWQEETGLTRYEQEGARKRLVSLGILIEERRGIPARLYYRLNLEALAEALQTSLGNFPKLEWGKPTNKAGEIPQTRVGNFPKLEWGKPTNKAGEIPQTNTETTTETTTEITAETTGSPPYPPTEIFESGRAPQQAAKKNDEDNPYFESTFEEFLRAYPPPAGGMPSRSSIKGIWHSLHLRGENLQAIVDGARRYRCYRHEHEPERPVRDPRNWLRDREWERPWDSADPEEDELRRRCLEEARAGKGLWGALDDDN